MSLVSSLFLHSSKPVTVAGFGCAGQEVVSGVKADGGTGKRNHDNTNRDVREDNNRRIQTLNT